MKNIKIVHDFFHSLIPTEKSVFRNMLRLFDVERGTKGGLSVKLFNLLKKETELKEETFYIKQLYGKTDSKSSEAFRKLIERFRDKMYESVILDINQGKPGIFTKLVASQVEMRKMLSIFWLIMIRGISIPEKKRIYNKVFKICYEYELFDELVIFLKLHLDNIDIHDGAKKTRQRVEEIIKVTECSNAILLSHHSVYLNIYDVQNRSIANQENVKQAYEAVQEIKLLLEKFPLDNIRYNYQLLLGLYYHYLLDYKKEELIFTEMIDFVINSSAVFTRNRVATCYMNVSYIKTYLYKFDEAIKNIVASREYYKYQSKSVQYYYQETEILLFIYTKQYQTAQEIMDLVIKNEGLKESALLDSKRAYIAAVIKFLTKNYKGAFKDLQDTKEIEAEKEGWNIGIRMLHIYLTLETEKIDLADQRIESLRKHIERTIKMKNIRKRDVVIFRIVNQLSRNGFNFKRVLKERQKDFELLKSYDLDYKWEARSHELILFDQWFEAKAKGIPYDPIFPKPLDD